MHHKWDLRTAYLSKYSMYVSIHVQTWIQWRKWQKWRKSPSSDGLSWMPKVAPWKLAILAKLAISTKIARGLVISRIWKIFKLDAKSGPFK